MALLSAPFAAAQSVPYWDNGNGSAINFDPAPWPSEAQWLAYTRNNSSINDQRTQDPSNGGTSPQAYVNVSSGCNDQALPSVYYYYDSVRQVIFYRWRVENGPNNYATGPSPGSFGATNPWNSAQWTVMFDLNGDGYRDFAAHLNGSTGSPATPIDNMVAIWSPTLSNTLDYVGDPANVHVVATNPTAFVQGTSGNTNNQLLQFNGSAAPTAVQWPNGSSETVWDYGTTRATDVSTSSCREYYVDYQIPLAMLDATAFGGPAMTPTTPFSFMFATANSLNNPFQKDIVLNGTYVCPPSAPAPFGDPLTLGGGIIEQAITTSITATGGSCTAVPLRAQVLDSLQVTNCQTISTLVSGTFFYYFDVNGDGLANDGSTWTEVTDPTSFSGTTMLASWNTNNLVQGNYLIAAELEDSFGHTTHTWQSTATPPDYTNFPLPGVTPAAEDVNYTTALIGPPCGAPPPAMTKVASSNNASPGGALSYTLTITNNAGVPMTVSTITDTLPAGFSYVSNGGGTLGAPSSSPAPGATGTISWTFPANTTVPANESRDFLINVLAGSSSGTFYNTATAITSFGTIGASDNTGVTLTRAAMTLAKSISLASAPAVPVTKVNRGDVVRFTLAYSNNSEVNVTGVAISDPLPAGFTFVQASNTPSPTSAPAIGANGTVVWTIGTVNANSGPFTVWVEATATVAGTATNTATLTSANAPTVTASANVFVSGPVLAIAKTANTSFVVPTANVDYTITYTNIGDATANITTVTDVVPAGFTLSLAAPTTAGCTQSGTTVTCTVNATLAAGASGTRTLRFGVGPTAPDPSVNTATVNASNAPSVSANYSLAVGSATCVTDTYYLHRTTTDVADTPNNSWSVGYTTITAGGAGYTSTPTVTFSAPPPGGTAATGTAVVNDNIIVGITLTNPGSGYTAAPTVSILGGGGAGATATATLTSTQRIANETAPTNGTAATIGPVTIPTTPIEVARFYGPVLTDALALTTITGATIANPIARFYVDKTGAPQVQARLRLYDYDPSDESMTLVGEGFSEVVSGNKTNEPHTVTSMPIAANTIIAAGHRLLWTIEYASNNQENDVTFRYDGTGSSAFARVCGSIVRASVTKSVDKASAIPPEQLTYTITYSNPSTAAIPGVVVTDPLPAGLTFVSATGSPTSTPAVGTNGTIQWTVGTLAAGASGSFTVVAATTVGMTANSVTNTVTFESDITADLTASATTAIKRPNVLISKRVNDTTVVPGQSFAYTVEVINAGTGTASSVVVTDTLPSHISSTNYTGTTNTVAVVNITNGGTGYVTAPTVNFAGGGGSGAAGTAVLSGGAVVGVVMTNGGTGYTSAPAVSFSSGTAAATSQIAGVSVSGSNITFNVGTLQPAASAVFTINALVATSGIPAGATTLTNTASVVDSYDTTPRTATADVNLTAAPALTLTETATPSDRRVVYVNVTAGGTYTTIPTVSFLGGGCSGVTGVVSVTGTPGNYSVTGVTITNPGSGCTAAPTVVFTGAGAGGATATPTIGPAPGDTITYQLTVTNTGNADATGVVVFDDIPNYTEWTSGGAFSLGQVTFNVGTLAPSTPTILTYTVTVTDTLPAGVTALNTSGGATSTNTAPPPPVSTALSTGAAPGYEIDKSPDDGVAPFPVATLSANATASTTISVASARLVETGTYVVIGTSVAKVTGKTATTVTLDTAVTASSGTNVLQAVEYAIVYGNIGNAPGTNVVVSDVMPANLAYAGIPSGSTAPTSAPAIGTAGGTVTWNIGSLTDGGTGIVRFLAYALVSGVYTNTATIRDGNTLNTYNASDDATTTFGALDPIKITSTPSVINEPPTNIAHWTITVSNPLATPATNVAVIDNLPNGFTYKSGTTVINGSPAADPTASYIAGINLTAGGSGYTSAPAVVFTGGGGSGATARAYLTGGVVTSIQITNPGYGYSSAPSISFAGGAPGTGASATAFLSTPSTSPQWSGLTIPGGGSITIAFDADISANVPPGLYQNEIIVYGSTPSLTFDYLGTTIEDVQVCVPPPIVAAPPACGGSAGNVASILRQPGATVTWSITNANGTITNPATGTVHQVALGSGGSGYSLPPSVSFTGGGGSGAAAIASVSGGLVTAVTVTNPGSGYTSVPTVVFTPNGSGSGAVGAAVLGTGIVYTAGATGTIELLVTVVREFSSTTPACMVSSTESVSIDPPPTITADPADETVCNGTLASFSVTATNATAYQWQVSTNNGGSWSDVSGATAPTYAFTAANANSGWLYRVVVTRGPGCMAISQPALLTVSCTPDMAVITNDDTPDPVFAGNNITYTQSVQNIGPVIATNPAFTQTTPAGTTFVSMTPPAGWTCGITPAAGGTGAITCTANAGTLAAGVGSGDFTLVLKTNANVADGSTITDTASVSMTEVDPSPSNNSLAAETLVQRRVDVGIVKDNDAVNAPYGDDYLYTGNPPTATPLTYTLAITNDGPSLATNVVVTDVLPAQFDYDHTNAPATPSQGSCAYNAGTRTLTCSLGSMNSGAGATATITISGTVSVDSTMFVNTATVTRTETDTNAANDSSSSTVYVLAPTEVKMLTMDAVSSKSGVTITWQTGFEVDNLGFNVYRSASGGQMEKLNEHIITGSALFTGKRHTAGRSYRWKDKAGTPATHYYIEDVDLAGVRTMHGPVSPRLGSDDEPDGPVTDPDPGLGSVGGILSTPRGMGVEFAGRTAPLEQRTNQQWHLVSGQTAAKVIVTQAGWVRLRRSDLVAAGFDPNRDSKGLGVFADGIEVPIEVNDGGDNKFDDADTIEFFGTGIDTPTAGGRVYYIAVNKGKAARVKKHNAAKSGLAAPASFPYTYTRRERTVFFAALVNNGDNDNFFGAVVTTWPVSQPLIVENLDAAAASAELEIVLQGAAERLEHVVNVTLNGRPAGTLRFQSMDRHVAKLTIPTSWLNNGSNTLGLTATNSWQDVSVVESVRLTYPHLYRADDGALAFSVNGASEVNVAGFANDKVGAVDLTNAGEPLRLDVKMSAAADGTRSAKIIAPDGGTRTILVYADARVAAPAQIVLNAPSTWNDMKNEADLVIVSNRAFLDAASALKKAREAEGMRTAVVDVQNLYDEFSFGEHGPHALREFLKRSGKWKRAPRYAILLGDSSFDPRNYYAMGNRDFVPTKLVPTGYLKTASDDWFADFDDDGIPSIAIGRIPVRTAGQATAVVNKLINARTTSGAVTMVSDRNAQVKFEAGTAYVAQNIPSSTPSTHIKIGAINNPTAPIVGAFNSGSLLINYIGHGSVEVWSNVFSSATATSLTNGNKLPFVVAMNCLNGYFHDLFTDSLGEALLRNANGGAFGVWASSALTSPDQQTLMNAELYRQLFTGSPAIGDAILKAKAATKDKDVRRTFILFGDPTMKVR